ncbi:tRNA (adenosine(37)-N6)-dimethylallyltransferase MiaA [Gammaproteobacteria bacterium]|nr:tRNA (adenosine(37)-N6)-dimethylallyltransferase MiaA [Gammaproteobacteria bacterium]
MNNISKKPIAFILGPTASGKTELAIEICNSVPAEIISVDSVMVYEDCNIGSAKPSKDILEKYPHHLVNCIELSSIFSVSDFYQSSLELIDEIHSRNKLPLFVGGTMMYFRALINGLDSLPARNDDYRLELEEIKKQNGDEYLYEMLASVDSDYAANLNKSDDKRIIRALEVYKLTGESMTSLLGRVDKNFLSEKYNIKQLGILDKDRSILHKRIERRLKSIINDGLVEEVKNILDKYKIADSHPIRKSVNYKQAISFIEKEIDEDEFFNTALFATRQLAKRQITWMKSWDKLEIFEKNSDYKIKETIKRLASSL